MRKILVLTLREYRTSVRTKSFIVGIILAPILMGGGLIAFMLLKDRTDISDKKIVVIDHTEYMTEVLKEAAQYRNENDIFHSETGEQIRPAYILEFVEPETEDPFRQKLELSDRVRSHELHAYIEIGSGILYPGEDPENAKLQYFSEHSFMDDVLNWFGWPINNQLRKMRVADLGIDEAEMQDLFYWVNIESMGLVEIDRKTGDVKDAERSNELEAFFMPYILMLLMFMMVMMTAVPLLTSVMEEKLERIAEVILGSVTPFQFMMGKILGSISVSLTIAAVYVIGGIITADLMNAQDKIPYDVLPWFFIYMILFVVMVGSLMAALGSACNDNKDAQSLQFPAMIPVIIPMFIIVPVIQNPLSSFSTVLSLIPPFTPTLMLLRQSTQVSIPLWQPIAGVAGIILFTMLSVWIGGRIFRTGILMQGQKPTLKNLFRYAIRG
jgi:ABC-2 type transport system permease protein